MPYVTTEAMQLFLDRFAETIDEDEHVAMVLDQAGWHGAKALAVPSNITLVPLPPCSPELNPANYRKTPYTDAEPDRLASDFLAMNKDVAVWKHLIARIGELEALAMTLQKLAA